MVDFHGTILFLCIITIRSHTDMKFLLTTHFTDNHMPNVLNST